MKWMFLFKSEFKAWYWFMARCRPSLTNWRPHFAVARSGTAGEGVNEFSGLLGERQISTENAVFEFSAVVGASWHRGNLEGENVY
jgi:hypothetical protein